MAKKDPVNDSQVRITGPTRALIDEYRAEREKEGVRLSLGAANAELVAFAMKQRAAK